MSAVVSFGLAGALDPSLAVGAVLVPDRVLSASGTPARTSSDLVRPWRGYLADAAIPYGTGDVIGVDTPLLTPGDKASVRGSTGAVAVDMESHVAAAFADRYRLPFGVLRVVSDGALRALPPIVGQVMRPDGSIDIMRLLTGLLRRPRQIPSLIATGRDAGTAFRQLGRVGGLLDGRVGLHL